LQNVIRLNSGARFDRPSGAEDPFLRRLPRIPLRSIRGYFRPRLRRWIRGSRVPSLSYATTMTRGDNENTRPISSRAPPSGSRRTHRHRQS
jgi:hypothetical protein